MSGEMFRNVATSNVSPYTRSTLYACEETSMTRYFMPLSAASRIMRKASIDSGVVRSDSTYVCPSRQLSTEENSAALPCEWAFSTAWVKYAVVVLPLVPVMPTTVSSSCGRP